jgi:hypothetical protein
MVEKTMVRVRFRTSLISVLLLLAAPALVGQVRFKSPQPGDIYREYIRSMNGQDYLQVPDPNIDTAMYPTVKPFIPAPQIDIYIGDLSGAIRAEATIVYIGGHISTIGQKMRWNGNPWINIPLLDTSNGIPAGHQGYDYLMLHNVTLDIPLSQIYEGPNYFQGTSGTQGDPRYSFGWGQWGWYAMIVRIYYGPGKAHATGVITSPASGGLMNQNPTVTASITSGTAQKVDFLACYEDYDTDGDGMYLSYHHDYMMVDGQSQPYIKNHVGSATSAPWSVTWNTDWVPDQPAGQVKLVARIKDANNIWYVTPEVTQLSLLRTGSSVKLYKPLDIPERCWVKGDVNQGYGLGYQVVHFNIPPSDKLADATAAQYYIRLWNGLNVASQDPGQSEYRHFNNWSDTRFGADHHYTYDARTMPASALLSGTNTWQWYNTVSAHHGIEVLWPGPALAVRYTGDYASPVPGMASLSSPANGAAPLSQPLTLTWHPGLAAATYDVQISTDSLFVNDVTQETVLADTTVLVGPLAGQTIYFWRVRAVNQAGPSPYSTYWSFTTAVLPAATPSLSVPSNNAIDQMLDLTVRWHPAANAQRYHLQLGTDSTFIGGLVVNDSTIVDTASGVTSLKGNTFYFWRVRSANSLGFSAFASTWNFRTITTAPAAPQLVYPGNQSQGNLTSGLNFRWQRLASATGYDFVLGSDSSFVSGIVRRDSAIVDTFRVVSGLSDAMRYFWRVSASNSGGQGPFSPTWSFETAVPVPGGVTLIAPPHNAVLASADSIEFRWNRTVPAATKYWFEISTDSSFTHFRAVDSTLVDTSKIFRSVVAGKAYYWRIRGGNEGGWGGFSSVREFSIVITHVDPGGTIPLATTLEQNYPNPFNPSTVIRFGLTERAQVRLTVYNTLGEAVAELVNGEVEAGYHEIQFSGADLPSGVYFYRLEAGRFVQTKRLILLK